MGGEHTIHYTYYRTVDLKHIIFLTNVTSINVILKISENKVTFTAKEAKNLEKPI